MDDIDRFLYEDLGDQGDITSDALFSSEEAKGIIITKESCVLAGIEEASSVFKRTGAIFKINITDGSMVSHSSEIAQVSGSVRSILKGERLALNFLGRMSAIATTTRTLVDRCKKINPDIQIAATRKTTPGFRYFEKKAVKIGGGFPHRFGLFDAVLIKDNHIKRAGSLEDAIQKVRNNLSGALIEVEVEKEKDALLAASLGSDVIMLDNISPNEGSVIVNKIRDIKPDVIIEVSGGISPDNIEAFASYADRISLGYLTHTIQNIDFSLELLD